MGPFVGILDKSFCLPVGAREGLGCCVALRKVVSLFSCPSSREGDPHPWGFVSAVDAWNP